jgi:hypothetical protein
MSIIETAIVTVKNQGLNKIRCYLTGAPYATLDDNEIRYDLQSMLDSEPTMSLDSLVDHWELKALTFNSQLLPILRGVNTKSLLSFMQTGHAGQVKALTYLLTRLLYPSFSDSINTEKMRERMLFATHLYDAAIEWEEMRTMSHVQQLVMIDSYVSMPYWHGIWAFESSLSKMGLDKAPKAVRETFADPLRVTEDVKRIDSLIKYMYELMLHCAETDGAIGRPGNRLSQQIMLVQAAHLPKQVIPHFQKTLSEADKIRMENRRRMESKNQLKFAHSAIHGKGVGVNYHDDPVTMATMATRNAAKRAAEAKESPLAKALREIKEGKVGAAKPQTTSQKKSTAKVNANVQNAMAKLSLSPAFQAALDRMAAAKKG